MLTPSELPRLTGHEQFTGLNATVMDFWRWAFGDLRMNTNRGVLAEFLVAVALGVTGQPRIEWADYDLLAAESRRIEVKSAAYLQSWEQRVAGPIRFTGLTTRASSDTEGLDVERTVKADLYVFALQTAKEHSRYDPLDVGQWQFWVIPATTVAGWAKQSVGLTWLEAQSVPSVRWDELNDAVSRAAAP